MTRRFPFPGPRLRPAKAGTRTMSTDSNNTASPSAIGGRSGLLAFSCLKPSLNRHRLRQQVARGRSGAIAARETRPISFVEPKRPDEGQQRAQASSGAMPHGNRRHTNHDCIERITGRTNDSDCSARATAPFAFDMTNDSHWLSRAGNKNRASIGSALSS